MPHHLRSYELNPPGGYYYVQSEGIQRSFPAVPIIEDLAKSVSAFRRGNGLPRADLDEAMDDVDCWTCARLGNSRRWCVNRDHPIGIATPTTVAAGAPCQGCGAGV